MHELYDKTAPEIVTPGMRLTAYKYSHRVFTFHWEERLFVYARPTDTVVELKVKVAGITTLKVEKFDLYKYVSRNKKEKLPEDYITEGDCIVCLFDKHAKPLYNNKP